MGVWDVYEDRMNAHGVTKRDTVLKREIRAINSKVKDNLSYNQVTIDDIPQMVSIINSDNLDEKKIISMPGEDIKHGGLVYWMDNYWLITERDANTTIYTAAKMVQCNHLLKWVSDDNVIHEQWCIIEDGTKYLTGEYEDRSFVVTRGDSRIAMTIARNEYTVNFNREQRFLIDDPESKHKLAYLLTKPFKLGGTFNNEGVFKFVLQETTATSYDNHELGIADYYKYFPRPSSSDDEKTEESGSSEIENVETVKVNSKEMKSEEINGDSGKRWL